MQAFSMMPMCRRYARTLRLKKRHRLALSIRRKLKSLRARRQIRPPRRLKKKPPDVLPLKRSARCAKRNVLVVSKSSRQREPLVRLLVLPPLLMSLQLIMLRRGQRRLLMLISPIRSHLKKNALRVKRPKLKQKLVEPQLNAMLKRNVRLKRACGEINVRARQHLRYQWMYQARAKQQHRNLQLVRLIGSIHCCLKSKANSSVFRVKKQR